MVKQMNRTVEYGNMPFGPYVMRTKIDEDIRIRLLKDGKKELTSYHKRLAGQYTRDRRSCFRFCTNVIVQERL